MKGGGQRGEARREERAAGRRATIVSPVAVALPVRRAVRIALPRSGLVPSADMNGISYG